MESDKIFKLIDSVLPFEACLYHQVLPLSLEGNVFTLGIVDPEDDSALEYVQKILAYMNCSVVTQLISSEAQRSMLSAYLFHTSQPQTGSGESQSGGNEDGIAVTKSVGDRSGKSSTTALQSQSSEEISLFPVLKVQTFHSSSPVEVLATLPPQELLLELLGRVLEGGIGRLFFERQQGQGRILWSQEGVLKSILEGLDESTFQGVIDELKRLTQLPLIPVEQPKQVEIEQVYQDSHLLLRLRVMPGTYGEEATLQVLRGAALRFYQQQQLSALSQDAMRLAEQLHRKVNEIRDRTRLAPAFVDVSALELLLKSVDEQLEALIAENKSDPS